MGRSSGSDHGHAPFGHLVCSHRWLQLVYGTVTSEVRSGIAHARRGERRFATLARRRMEGVVHFVLAAGATRPSRVPGRERKRYQTAEHEAQVHRGDDAHPCWHSMCRGGYRSLVARITRRFATGTGALHLAAYGLSEIRFLISSLSFRSTDSLSVFSRMRATTRFGPCWPQLAPCSK